MQNAPWRILLVIKAAADNSILLGKLKASNRPLHLQQVDNAAELNKALTDSVWDVVIGENIDSQFGLMDGLKEIKNRDLDIPCIVFCEKLTEENVSKVMEAGAKDCITKEGAARLLPAIEREIEEAENRKKARQLEEQYRHAEKMEILGRLVGGVAHDFNNLLTTILGNVSFLMAGPEGNPNWKEDLGEIKKAAQRAASLTSQLLAFTRRQALQPKVLDLNFEIKNVEKIIGRSIGEDIHIQMNLAPNLYFVTADSGHIEQVLMGLAVNAKDAMPNGGALTIQTENLDLKEDLLNGNFKIPKGNYVLLTISDTGKGMDEDLRTHIFEPFFTSKDRKIETGLGLATVYGIIKQNGGFIECESALGEGTTFRIYFPRTDSRALEEKNNPEVSSRSENKTILLLDDEKSVRQLTARMLKMAGYFVLEAGSASEAKKILEEAKESPQLLLSDVVLPDQNGMDFAASIRPAYPHLKVIFMSGYLDRPFGDFKIEENAAFLQKPFNQEELLQKISQVLKS